MTERDQGAAVDYGTLEVQVFTADRAQPLAGALVIVSEQTDDGEKLIRIMTTNGNGTTEELRLPAPPAVNSESPGGTNLFYKYNIRVDYPGYYSIENINVPIFAGCMAIQPVRMVPLPDTHENGKKIIYIEDEPEDLQ